MTSSLAIVSDDDTTPALHVNADPFTDTKDFKFSFKKDALENKRPTVELKLPVPSYEGIVRILETGGKELELLVEAMYDTIRGVASEIVGQDENINQENFPVDKILWKSIATMAREDRRSSGISKETWEAFEKKAERKNIKTTPPPPNKHTDLGKLILPSKNRAIAQKIMQRVSPITKSNPLEISIGIFVKGKKKTGNNTTTKKSDRNESRSNIFVYISSLYYSLI